MESAACSVRICTHRAEGKSPITCLPLCLQHLQRDIRKCNESESAVTEKVAIFKKYLAPMRLMQQRLASDLQLLDDTFHELRESLDKCQAELTAAITKHHDQLMESLKILSELDDFQAELKAAKDANDLRQVFSVNEGMRESFESFRIDSKLVHFDESTQQVKLAAFPDVNSAVRDMKACFDNVLSEKLAQVRSIDASRDNGTDLRTSTSATQLNLNGDAQCMAMCSNTIGFSVDRSKKVVKSQLSLACRKLPQPMVFVAIRRKLKQRHEGKRPASTISLISVDPELTGFLTLSWEVDQPIRDLHCDNDRQLLFIAQHNAVRITDLSGDLKSTITVSDLQTTERVRVVCCIAGDSDKLFVLAEMSEGRPSIFGLLKESNEVQLRLRLPDDCNLALDPSTRMAVCDRMLLVSDFADVFTVCSITGLVVGSEAVNKLSNVPEMFREGIDCSDADILNDLHRCFNENSPMPRASILANCPLNSAALLKFEHGENVCLTLQMNKGDVFVWRSCIA